jgi:DNA recombination protein RmuC
VELTPLEIILLVLLVGSACAVVWLVGERFRLLAERNLARGRLVDREADEERMRDSFRSLAAETLSQSTSQFLKLAERALDAQKNSAAADFERRRAAVDELVKPIHVMLQRAERQLRLIEKDRTEAYAGLRAQVTGMAASGAELARETSKLARALGKPNVRGRYGELQLQRVAELAGMQQHCDFAVQANVRDGDGNLLRPDMIVKLPNGRVLAVDAKTSLDAYVEALAADSEAAREQCLERFADHVARQVQELARRGYWRQFSDSPEFVVMFIPGDQFIDAALERRPELIESSARRNVILASPSTLIGLLRAVHVGWRERRLSESAEELFALGRELHARIATAMAHADKLGGALEQTLRRYNEFVGSVQTRLLPTLRRFEERGVRVGEEVAELEPVESAVRHPGQGELYPQPATRKLPPAPDSPADVVPAPPVPGREALRATLAQRPRPKAGGE